MSKLSNMVLFQHPILEPFLWICNTLFHQSIAVVAVFIIWVIVYNNDLTQFFLHRFLSTLGYIPLMAEAVILLSNENSWSHKIDRKLKHFLHGILMLVSTVLATTGMAIGVVAKDGAGMVHLESTHAWTGLVSWILILLSQILGFVAANPQPLSRICPSVYPKLLHNFFGLLGYIFGIVSLCYGLYAEPFLLISAPDSRLACVWVLGFATFWSVLAPLISLYYQVNAILFA